MYLTRTCIEQNNLIARNDFLLSISLRSAGKQAALPAHKRLANFFFVAAISSSSVTATAVPPGSRASSIRKSPIALAHASPTLLLPHSETHGKALPFGKSARSAQPAALPSHSVLLPIQPMFRFVKRLTSIKPVPPRLGDNYVWQLPAVVQRFVTKCLLSFDAIRFF